MKKDLNVKRKYTTKTARAAYEKGRLHEWVQEYLLNEGNVGLAKALREERAIMVDIVEFPLSLLRKIEGPEEPSARQPLDVWEQRVTKIEKLIKGGKDLPPLIVTDFWRPLEIVDGNHRHEAFIRNGVENFWTIFFLNNEINKDLVKKHSK